MTYLDLEENEEEEEVSVRYVEHMGRSFKLICTNPHGYWKIHHATNNKPSQYLSGSYTSLGEATKAVKSLREDQLPPIQKRKVVLTPKKKNEEDEE